MDIDRTEAIKQHEWRWIGWVVGTAFISAWAIVDEPPTRHNAPWSAALIALDVLTVFRALIACIRLGRIEP